MQLLCCYTMTIRTVNRRKICEGLFEKYLSPFRLNLGKGLVSACLSLLQILSLHFPMLNISGGSSALHHLWFLALCSFVCIFHVFLCLLFLSIYALLYFQVFYWIQNAPKLLASGASPYRAPPDSLAGGKGGSLPRPPQECQLSLNYEEISETIDNWDTPNTPLL